MTPNFRSFRADPVAAERVRSTGAARISAWSDRPFGRNAFVRAWVGSQEVTQVTIDQFGMSFAGFTAAMPGEDDTLSVEIDGAETIDTGLTAESHPPVV
jgi:hypothetical protein